MMIRFIPQFLLIFAILPSVQFFGTNPNQKGEWPHRHRLRHNRSPHRSLFPFPTSTTPVDFQFTAAHYNLSVYENSIGQRAIASSPSSAQMFGVWLPRGYHQIQFRIIEGDKNNRFGVSAKRLGNFAFLQLEHKDQMDVLNRELQHQFQLVVRATAKRRKGLALEAMASINLEVLDENDNPPMFRELNYQVRIDPSTIGPLNERLVQLEAFDADEGQNGQLYYSLAKPSSHFYIEPRTGWLRTFGQFDPQKMPSNSTLDVRIEDRASRIQFHQKSPNNGGEGELMGHQIEAQPMFAIRNRATVEIVVLEENETPKMRRQKPKLHFRQHKSMPIRHSPTKVGTIHLAQEAEEDASLIHLELSRHNSEFVWNCAQIERQNAGEFDLWLCPPFPKDDSEEESTLTIRISVFRISKFDGRRTAFGDQEFQIRVDSTIGQKIWLEGGNDGAENEGPTKIQINETFPPDIVIWQFHANLNHGDKNKIRFKIQRPNGQQPSKFPFELDKLSGQLRLLKMPSSIGQREWNISVVAQIEMGTAQKSLRLQSAPQHFQIALADSNDHCPEFGQIPLGHLVQLEKRHLAPKMPSDGIIWRAKATDRDFGENGEIIYKLMGDKYGIFEMDPIGGELQLKGIWPSELEQIRLKILAMDRGWPQSQQTLLELIIQRPQQKNGTNQNDNYQGKAVEQKMLQSTCQMQNDHAPEFSTPIDSIIGQIDQMAPEGTTIGHISAFDRDEFGPNGIVQYWLLGNNSDHFGLDPISGRLFLRRSLTKLSMENLQKISGEYLDLQIKVMAADFAAGQKQKMTKGKFRVKIRGQNVHSPIFSHFAYRIAVREGNQPGQELLKLGAKDADWGQNGQIEFRMALEMDWLSLDPDSGKIRAERPLDREGELGEQFTFIVMALDRGSPSKVAFANVTIILEDINDQSPQCARPIQTFRMPEDGPDGMMVGCIGAFDLDAPNTKNSEIRFELIRPKAADGILPFRVNQETGCIFVNTEEPLDFEQRQKYEFTVKLHDLGSPPLSSKNDCQIEIQLDDIVEGNQPPNFAEIALEASIYENSLPGTDVLRVHAEGGRGHSTDRQIRYRLVGGNGFGHFTLNSSTGMVSTLKELDHEEHQQFWLTIRAEDGHNPSLHSHQHILVRVLNQNDRLPIFTSPLYEAMIDENCEENKVVLKVEATDADEQRFEWGGGGGGKDRNNAGNWIKYSIVKGDPKQNFAIDEQNGYIVCTKQPFNKELQSEFELEIRACDQGGLCSKSIAQIGIEEAASNSTLNPRPIFAQPNVQLELSSQMPVGFVLHNSIASVPNETNKMIPEISHPQRIQYSLYSADDQAAFDVFRVDSVSGNLILERLLPERMASPFTLVISASFSGQQQNAGFTVLKMRRRPENEHSPMFVQFDAAKEQQINLPEEILPGDLVYKIEAVDPDQGDFGKIIYTLAPSQGNVGQNEYQKLFSLNVSTGELRMTKQWPSHLTEVFLTIRASDSAPSMPKSTKCHLRILGPKSFRQPMKSTELHFSVENPSNLSSAKFLGFLNETTHQILPSGANFVFDENDGNEWKECKKLLNIHFATGKLQFNGIFTDLSELNCSISLISTFSDQNLTYSQFFINLKFLSNEDLNLWMASEEFCGQIQIGSKIGSSVLFSGPSISGINNNSPQIPLKLELAPSSSPINGAIIQFRLLSPMESNFILDQNDGQIRTIFTLEFQQNQTNSWEFPVLAQQLTNNLGSKKLKYSQPSLVKIALNWPKNEGNKTLNEFIGNEEENNEYLDEQNPTNFLDINVENGIQFGQQIYNLSLRENQIGRELLLSIWPTNFELGHPFKFTLFGQKSAVEWMNAFKLDENVGLLWLDNLDEKVPKLDRERRAQIWLGIRAKFGPSNDVAVCLVQITLEDINDNAPEFDESKIVGWISEAAKPGDRLLQVRAKDPDSGMNGAVRYFLGQDAPQFIELNKYDGKMTVSAQIAEQKLQIGQRFVFNVMAVDRGQPPANSTVLIELNVIHRYQPVFSHNIYSAQIDDLPIQYPHTIQQVRAWSNADGAQIRYWIDQNANEYDSILSHYFRLDFDRGQLFLIHPLPPNVNSSQFAVPIQALDITRRDAPAGNALIIVQPKFHQPNNFDLKWPPIFRWKVAEDLPIGSLIGRIELDNSTSAYPNSANFTIQIHQNGIGQQIQIEPNTGEVRLQSPLDFEQCARMEFQILAQNDDKLANGLLQLDILNANDNLPEFTENGTLELAVADEQQQIDGQPLFLHKFIAKDADGGGNPLQFIIVPNLDDQQFPANFLQLDPENGVLTANWTALNEQEKQELQWPITLNISVNDGLHSAYKMVNLFRPQIQSTNFHFEQNIFTAILSAGNMVEGKSIGIVQAKGGNGPYKFGIAAEMDGNETWPISIGELSGRISLKYSFNKNGPIPWTRFPIPILAIDSSGQKAFAQIQLKIAEENLHSPKWIGPLNGEGYEIAVDQWTAEGGDEILRILAVDEDEGDRLEYQIIGNENAKRLFHLNSSTGILSILKLNDQIREELAKLATAIEFSVRVADTGNPPHKSEMPICIQFLPKLASGPPPFSRVPQFGQVKYLFAVPEDVPIGHFIGQLQIRNENAFSSGRVRFAIINEGQKDIFVLDNETGKLTLKRQLDAEKQSSHHLLVQICRQDEPKLCSFSLVSISVIDVNDLAPKFLTTPSEILQISENLRPGTVIAAFLAMDGDLMSEQNGGIKYSLEAEDDDADAQIDWAIDAEQGWLQIGPGGLDRERKNEYTLRIIATDGDGKRAIQSIQIRILDVNDSPPQFERKFQKLSLKIDEKMEKNAKLASFKLMDLDEEKMEKLQMTLWQNPFGMFRVEADKENPSIQNLFLAQFPPPSAAFSPNGIFSTNVTIIAFDGLLSSFGLLQLEMEYPNLSQHSIDEFDCAKQFKEQSIKIAGNLSSGHSIFQVPNSQNRIEMFSPGLEDAFQVRNHSSLVVLGNYNRQREFTLKLRIYQGESNKNGCLKEGDKFGCIQLLKITVENANRMAPQFAMPNLILNVSEDSFKFTEDGQMHILTRLEAIDEDWGKFGQIKFEIVRPENGPFWVDADTGVLSLIGPLDREDREQYLFEVIAKDGGGLSTKMTIKINVLDVNDNAPECAQPLYQVQLFENDFNRLDLQLEATDKDQHGHGFMFKLDKNVPEKLAKIIHVSPNGRIQLADGMAFDFEEWKTLGTTQIGHSIVIEFGVSISDLDERLPLTGECRVQLIILDVNDNPPKFELPLYEAQIKENAPIGTNIIQLSASDIDSQHFGKVSYSMISARIMSAGNKSELKNEEEIELTNFDENEYLDHFTLDDENGWLRTAKPFDFEQIGGNNLIQLRIRAQDGGEPPLSGETMLNIRILDQNDNQPQILDCTKLTAIVQEGIAPGHSLLTFTVQDADSNGNAGPFRLELFGNGADAFAIDPLYNLITTRQLHFAERNEFQLKVQATDVGGLSSQLCPIRIRVQPQSRHPPIVQSFNVQLMALHGEFLGGKLGQIHATDQDPTDLLRFTLMPNGNNQNDYKRFSINPENGELFAQPDLLPGLHRFNVSVTDGKFESQALISVEVIKIDQEALDHSMSVRFRSINAQRFIQLYMRRFMNLLARLVGVQSNNVRILSIQEIGPSNVPTSAILNKNPSPSTSTISTPTTTIKTTTRPNVPQKHGNHQQKQHRWRRTQRQHSIDHHFGHRERRGQITNSQKTQSEVNLDLLVAVQRADAGGPTAQFHRPAFVKQRLEAGMGQFIQNELPGLEMISLTSEVCRRDTCIRGDCRDRLWLDNAQLNTIENGRDGFSFIGPGHLRTFECICRQGYAGPNCDVPVNKCSKELCRRVELCIPTTTNAMESREDGGTIDEEGIGFNCACPSGFRGPTCSESICPSNAQNHEECSRQNEAISLLGQGYIELHIAGESTSGNVGTNEFATSLESRMELTLDFRTVSANAVLMHGQGLRDYHTLRIAEGHIQYEWDCGSGRGLVQLGQLRVDNGIWHRLRMNRIGRLAKLSIENGRHKAEGTSPPGSDVLNLFGHSSVLIFGARVEPSLILRRQLADTLNGTKTTLRGKNINRNGQLTADELRVGLHEGMIGCIGRIALDGLELPKTQPGIRLFNAAIGCDERSLGPCLGSPCRNGVQCIPNKAKNGEGGVDGLAPTEVAAIPPFTCQCPARFTGAQCEIDLNACAAHPCPNGIPCHNLYGDFHCSCPTGFTGKTCQLRGDWDPCVTAQCGPNGKCLRQKTTFTCQCQSGWTGPFCLEAVEIGIGMGETDKDNVQHERDEENATGKWLMELFKAHRFLLLFLCSICLLIFVLTFTAICLYRHCQKQKRQKQRDRHHLNGANRRLKKSSTNNGTTLSGSFSKGTTELPPIVVRSGRRRQQQDGRGNGGNDPAFNPLVPRETAAPSQCTADRPPPPLPPRYHRRDANGTALPTVEVKPMPAATNRQNESQQKLNGLKGDNQNGSLKSAGGQSSQNNNNSNGLLMGSLRRKNGGISSKGSTTPVPPPRHSSGELASENGKTPEQPLRALGRPLTEEEMRELNLSSSIHSPGARGSAAGSYGRKIDQACTAAANTQKQKAKPMRNSPSSIPMVDSDESTSDYLTMKPVHRAKPFMAKANGRKAGEESGAPPPPPLHRTPPIQHQNHNNGRTSSKLYDNPTDACQEEDDELNSPK